MVLILGVDPGVARVGYGLLKVMGPQRYLPLGCGCIFTSPGKSMEARLVSIYRDLLTLIHQYQPQVMALEKLFFNKNARTAFEVGQARGVALLAAAHGGLEVAEYAPLEVKQAVAGHGRATKAEIQRMVQLLLGLEEKPHPDDVADALAVALCHACRLYFPFR